MQTRSFSLAVAGACALALAGCGSTPPTQINDICAVFAQRDGLFNDWYAEAKKAEQSYGIPVHVLMATVRVESGFDGDARPPRKTHLGFIPGKRASSALGYSQALNGTWEEYQRETGRGGARRTDFGASVDFIGWYHRKTVERFGAPPDDAYSLYLAYHSGWSGYQRGVWRERPVAQKGAAKAADMASRYQAQMTMCGL
jgi:hypothetical protein